MSIPASLAANPRLDRWVGFETAGRARVAIGKVEYGQGALTGLAQIAAEELDVAMESGSTWSIPRPTFRPTRA